MSVQIDTVGDAAIVMELIYVSPNFWICKFGKK